MILDSTHLIAQALNAKITPQAFLLDPQNHIRVVAQQWSRPFGVLSVSGLGCLLDHGIRLQRPLRDTAVDQTSHNTSQTTVTRTVVTEDLRQNLELIHLR